MAGNANSGRHPIYVEYHKAAAINKLWEKLHNKIDKNEELTEFEEKLVGPLLSRTIKTEQDLNANVAMAINIDKDIADKNAINESTEDNSEGQPQV